MKNFRLEADFFPIVFKQLNIFDCILVQKHIPEQAGKLLSSLMKFDILLRCALPPFKKCLCLFNITRRVVF